jgi:trehalose/maltose transport system substrate-binding protein
MRDWICCTVLATALAAAAGAAPAAEITLSCGWQELEVQLCEEAAAAWSAESGHQVVVRRGPEQSNQRYFEYLDLLSRADSSLDVLQIDVIWPSAFADHLVDLAAHVPPEVTAQHFEALIGNNTVDGRLVALPWFTDAGILYYRSDLLARYGLEVPETWSDLAEAALVIQEGERAAGNPEFWGLVFQGQAYEGLTCNALEWIAASGGGRIVDEQGEVTVNNPAAALALARAASWVGTVAPSRVTQFVEEDARITFQLGNAAFMRNWPYAWALLNAENSDLRGKVGIAPLPRGGLRGAHAATLGGWQLAVSRHSNNQEAAIDFVRYLTSTSEQKRRAIAGSYAPTIPALYDDPEVLAANPFFADFAAALPDAVARPSALAGKQYAQVSTLFWEAAHATLIGNGTARDNLARLEDRLRLIKGRAGW